MNGEDESKRKKSAPSLKEESFQLQGEAKFPVHLATIETESEGLLTRTRTQWLFGDWDSIVTIDPDLLDSHPEREELALLVAAAHAQKGEAEAARDRLAEAQHWGCDPERILRILTSGLYNTLGRAAALTGENERAGEHFESALRIGAPEDDSRLLSEARRQTQEEFAHILGHLQVDKVRSGADNQFAAEHQLGILILGGTSPEALQAQLESLRLQGGLARTWVWMPENAPDRSRVIVDRYAVAACVSFSFELGFLDLSTRLAEQHSNVLVLSKSCFLLEGGLGEIREVSGALSKIMSLPAGAGGWVLPASRLAGFTGEHPHPDVLCDRLRQEAEAPLYLTRRPVCSLLGQGGAGELLSPEELWARYDRSTPPCDYSRKSYGLDELDLRIMEALDPLPETGTFVEIGGYDGVTQSNSVLLEKRGWRGMLVEAVPAAYAKCVRARPRAVVRHAFACRHGGGLTPIIDVGLMSLGSVGTATAANEEWLSRGEGFTNRARQVLEVPRTTLSELIDEAGIGAPDLLLLDVEGGEVEVLSGLDFEKHAPDIIVAEDAYEEGVAKYLRKKGYSRSQVLLERPFTRDCLYLRS